MKEEEEEEDEEMQRREVGNQRRKRKEEGRGWSEVVGTGSPLFGYAALASDGGW